MAQKRCISRSLSTSERFNRDLPEIVFREIPGNSGKCFLEFTQLLYVLLIPHLDDFGIYNATPFTVKNSVLPVSRRSEKEFEKALLLLHEARLISIYGDGRYLIFYDFDSHQEGIHKRTKSKYPPPSDDDVNRLYTPFPGNSGKFREIPLETKGIEQKGREQIFVPPKNGNGKCNATSAWHKTVESIKTGKPIEDLLIRKTLSLIGGRDAVMKVPAEKLNIIQSCFEKNYREIYEQNSAAN